MSGTAATLLIRGKRVASQAAELLAPPPTVEGAEPSRRWGRSPSISRSSRVAPMTTSDSESFDTIAERIIGENRLVPIVAITSNTGPEHREAYLASGMNDVLGKPVTPSMVQEILGKYLTMVELSATRGLGASVLVSSKIDPAALGTTTQLSAGTREELLKALLHLKSAGPGYLSVFLLTFRSFMMPEELLAWLDDKFHGQTDTTSSASDLYTATRNMVSKEQGVVTVLNSWIADQWQDFASNPKLRTGLMQLIASMRVHNCQEEAVQLKQAVEKT
ncbi:hypothetical protein HKX48_007519, partial [Thoreauomyces humboldtii]